MAYSSQKNKFLYCNDFDFGNFIANILKLKYTKDYLL